MGRVVLLAVALCMILLGCLLIVLAAVLHPLFGIIIAGGFVTGYYLSKAARGL